MSSAHRGLRRLVSCEGAILAPAQPSPGGLMRQILAFIVVTVDGYYEGPDGEFDW
jgi:hypothetical protein